MRGMIKWKPFNSLLKNKDIEDIANNRLLTEKPIIMEDKIIEINNTINKAINNNLEIEIKFWHIKTLNKLSGKIENINLQEKYIKIKCTRIYFKDIINVNLL